MVTRLRWSGSLHAQAQADRAFAKLRPKVKPKKKKKNKAKWRPKPPAGEPSFYFRYIASPEWKAKRAEFIAAQPCCEVCEATEHLQVHHKHYRTLGRESRGDVEILCHDCHAFEHEGNKVGAVDSTTAAYLALEL